MRLAPAVGGLVAARHEQAAVVDEGVAATEEVRRGVERLADDGAGGRVPDVGPGEALDVVVAGDGVLLAREEDHLAGRQQARVDADEGVGGGAVEREHVPPRHDD